MAKFNAPVRNYMRERRAKKSELKRKKEADPVTNKLKITAPLNSVSGKRKRKLLKKWRREQKNALESGLVSMEDIQMMAVDNQDEAIGEKTEQTNARGPMQLHLKKRAKLKIKKGKGKGKESAQSNLCRQGDAMVE